MNIETCEKCGKQYSWHETNAHYPGGKEKEVLICPHCKHQKDGPWMTSGFFETEAIESAK